MSWVLEFGVGAACSCTLCSYLKLWFPQKPKTTPPPFLAFPANTVLGSQLVLSIDTTNVFVVNLNTLWNLLVYRATFAASRHCLHRWGSICREHVNGSFIPPPCSNKVANMLYFALIDLQLAFLVFGEMLWIGPCSAAGIGTMGKEVCH